jgi:hypothetical protein
MPDVLCVPAFQFGNPMAFRVLMKANDLAGHAGFAGFVHKYPEDGKLFT